MSKLSVQIDRSGGFLIREHDNGAGRDTLLIMRIDRVNRLIPRHPGHVNLSDADARAHSRAVEDRVDADADARHEHKGQADGERATAPT